MKYFIFGATLGVLLSICGIQFYEWQFYAIIIPITALFVSLTK